MRVIVSLCVGFLVWLFGAVCAALSLSPLQACLYNMHSERMTIWNPSVFDFITLPCLARTTYCTILCVRVFTCVQYIHNLYAAYERFKCVNIYKIHTNKRTGKEKESDNERIWTASQNGMKKTKQ